VHGKLFRCSESTARLIGHHRGRGEYSVGIMPGMGVCSNISTARMSLTLRDCGEAPETPEGSGRTCQLRAKSRRTWGENRGRFVTLAAELGGHLRVGVISKANPCSLRPHREPKAGLGSTSFQELLTGLAWGFGLVWRVPTSVGENRAYFRGSRAAVGDFVWETAGHSSGMTRQ